MPRYFFDLIDGIKVAVDDVGICLSDIQAAQEEAARSIADVARDGMLRRDAIAHISIEVRSDDGLLMRVKLLFEIVEQI
jgi:hypothetical protein